MLTQIALRAVRTARAPLSPRAQPCAPLQPSLTRTLQTTAPRTPLQGISRQQLRRIPPRPSIQTLCCPRPSPVSSAFRLPSGRRPFSSSWRSYNPRSRYNRFNGGGRQSVFFTLVQNARPYHFVLFGFGVSGIYFYNTDVVEVGFDLLEIKSSA